jgi:hypothetical protein
MAKKHSESLGKQVERKVKELIRSFPQEEGVFSVSVAVRANPAGSRYGKMVTV